MSVGENGICVRILEKEFRVACSESQESVLREAAQYLDKQMRTIRQTGRVIGLERIAVMAALNIANELLTLKKTAFEPDEAFSERLRLLQEKIDSVLAIESSGDKKYATTAGISPKENAPANRPARTVSEAIEETETIE